jgi:hypothetical protein
MTLSRRPQKRSVNALLTHANSSCLIDFAA